MSRRTRLWTRLAWLAGLALLLTACNASVPPIVQTVVVTQAVTPVVQLVTPTPPPSPPPTLQVCVGPEPGSLYLYSPQINQVGYTILEALYDGPIDMYAYGYRAVALEELPTLANGGARLEPATVSLGEPIVDADGQVTVLQPGVRYRPSGCFSQDCTQALPDDATQAVLDRLVVTFRLRPDLTWEDGVPVTAHDSVFSFRIAADPATPVLKWYTDRTASYEAADDHTVVWTGLPGYMDPAYFLRFWPPLPLHLWGERTAADLLTAQDANRQPLAWGPYRLTEWEPGQRLVLEPNPYYFRKAEGRPFFQKIIVRFVGQDANQALAMLMAGECDVVSPTVGLEEQWDLVLQLRDKERVQVHATPSAAFEHLGFVLHPVDHDDGYQYGDPPGLFVDPRTRQGLALCLDRAGLVHDLLHDAVPVAHSYLPEDHPLRAEDAPRYAYDPAAGQALLEEAGWVDHDGDPATPRVFRGRSRGIPTNTPLAFTLDTTTAKLRGAVAERIRADLAQCGAAVEIRTSPPGELFASGPTGPLFGRRAQAALFAWATDLDTACRLWLTDAIPGPPEATIGDIDWLRRIWPEEAYDRDAFAYDWGGWNYHAYSNPEFDRACKDVLFSPPNSETHQAAARRAQEILLTDLPMIPLYPRLKLALTRPDLCGFRLDPVAPTEWWGIEDWAWGDACRDE